MPTRSVIVAVFAAAFVMGQTPRLQAQEKLNYISGAGGIGPRAGSAPRDTWPWLYAGVAAFEEKTFRPVAWFGAYKEPDKKAQYLYVLVFKTAEDFKSEFPLRSAGGSVGSKEYLCKVSLEFAKKKVETDCKIELDEKRTRVVKTFLSIGGKEVKEGEPRVFLVDLTQEKVAYHPVKVELPKDVPDMADEKRADFDVTVRSMVEQLRKTPELKKLLESTPKR